MAQQQRDVTIVTEIAHMQAIAEETRLNGGSVGCIPTMGSLHTGHASLINASSGEHQVTVASVFVNPTQFGPNEDFDAYPRSLESDIELIARHGGTHVFAPSVAEMYPLGFSTKVHVAGITDVLEGALRPGHFDGVSTVVCKLFQAMLPDVAYFGQKDYQQTLVIRQMVRDLFIPVEVSVQPTIREDDGLAMSSRNVYLDATDRVDATVIFQALESAKDLLETQGASIVSTDLEETMATVLASVSRLKVEYAVAVDAETLLPCAKYSFGDKIALLIAARLGKTRLIDNFILSV